MKEYQTSKARLGGRANDICMIGVSVAVCAAMAQISIPLPFGVPVTLQTFAIIFVAAILGAGRATAAAVVYVLLGAIGLPIFANFSGGLGIITGPTGGFILAFPILAFFAGIGADLFESRSPGPMSKLLLMASVAAGSALLYLAGTAMFVFVTGNSFVTALVYCVFPFIVTDAIKAALAAMAGLLVRSRVALLGRRTGI